MSLKYKRIFFILIRHSNSCNESLSDSVFFFPTFFSLCPTCRWRLSNETWKGKNIPSHSSVTSSIHSSIILSLFLHSSYHLLCMKQPFQHLSLIRTRYNCHTVSKSTIPMVPTPAAARYVAHGQPRPPAPTIRTDEEERRS